MDDFTALNFMGIIRIYNKRASKHHSLLSKVVPRASASFVGASFNVAPKDLRSF